MGLPEPGASSASRENRRRPTRALSTVSAFFGSRIAANSLRRNALSGDPQAPARLRVAGSAHSNSSPLPFFAAWVRAPATPLSLPHTPTTERLPGSREFAGQPEAAGRLRMCRTMSRPVFRNRV